MNNEVAQKIHQGLLEMLVMFHDFCRDNNLEYYIIGGTALGAARHKGFIPWDDDADIGMRREYYEKFKRIIDKLPAPLEVRYRGNDKKCPSPYIKLINSNTTLIEKFYTNYVEGLYIDILPLDYTFANADDRFREFKPIKFLYDVYRLHYSTRTRKGLKEVRHLFAKHLSSEFLYKQMEKRAQIYGQKNGNVGYLIDYYGSYGIKESYPVEVLGKPTLYQFENTMLYGPEDLDTYLKMTYDDYMKLPPEDQRTFRHSYHVLDFDTPYRRYIKDHT